MSIPVPNFDDLEKGTGGPPQSKYPIPVVADGAIPRIRSETLAKLMRTEYDCFERLLVFDCRFEPEFKAGHIVGAFNLTTQAQMKAIYARYADRKTAVVFHCEFSASRGPTWAMVFREYDRGLHYGQYPKIGFPDMFILQGGFASFWKEYRELTVGSYVGMQECLKEGMVMKRCQQQFKQETEMKRGVRTPDRSHLRKNESLPCSGIAFNESQPTWYH